MLKYFFILSFILCASINALSFDEYLTKELSEYSRFEYEAAALPSDIQKLDDARMSIDNNRSIKLNGSFLYVPIELKKENGQLLKSTITLKVKLYKYVFVALNSIKRGELISPLEFDYIEKEVTGIRSSTNINFNKKYRARTNISESSILELSIIEETPIVNIGSEVNAFKMVGNVMISFTAKAREEGKLGESIKILREDNKVFKAEVLDSLNVKIVE